MDSNLKSQIDGYIESSDVVLFMKGTTSQPMCGFSAKVVAILQHIGVEFLDIDVLQDMALREGIKEYSQWPTIPQLYIKGEFIGGSDITTELFNSGELEKMLSSCKMKNIESQINS